MSQSERDQSSTSLNCSIGLMELFKNNAVHSFADFKEQELYTNKSLLKLFAPNTLGIQDKSDAHLTTPTTMTPPLGTISDATLQYLLGCSYMEPVNYFKFDEFESSANVSSERTSCWGQQTLVSSSEGISITPNTNNRQSPFLSSFNTLSLWISFENLRTIERYKLCCSMPDLRKSLTSLNVSRMRGYFSVDEDAFEEFVPLQKKSSSYLMSSVMLYQGYESYETKIESEESISRTIACPYPVASNQFKEAEKPEASGTDRYGSIDSGNDSHSLSTDKPRRANTLSYETICTLQRYKRCYSLTDLSLKSVVFDVSRMRRYSSDNTLAFEGFIPLEKKDSRFLSSSTILDDSFSTSENVLEDEDGMAFSNNRSDPLPTTIVQSRLYTVVEKTNKSFQNINEDTSQVKTPYNNASKKNRSPSRDSLQKKGLFSYFRKLFNRCRNYRENRKKACTSNKGNTLITDDVAFDEHEILVFDSNNSMTNKSTLRI